MRRFFFQFFRVCSSPLHVVYRQPSSVRGLLLSYFIVSTVYSLGIQLYGPFLRSLVVCGAPAPPAAAAWSGSATCGDAAHVLAQAQAQEGELVSMKLVVHAAAGPVLGSLADRAGRKPTLLFSLCGFTVALILFFLMSVHSALHSFNLVVFCFFIEGATNAFDVVYMSMIADLTPLTDRAAAFTAYFLCGALGTMLAQLASVGILRLRLASYGGVWFALSAVLALDALFVWLFVPETLALPSATAAKDDESPTLPLAPGASCDDAAADAAPSALAAVPSTACEVAAAPLRLLGSEPFLRWWLASVICTGLAAGLSGIFASFSIAVYGWRPGDLQAWTWFSQLLRTSSISLLSPFANRCPPPAVLLLQVVATGAASIVQIFAPFSPWLLLGPLYFNDALAFTAPASAAFLSAQFGAEKQAKVNAVQHLCSNLSTSMSFALFSSPVLFRPEARGAEASRPFYLAAMLLLTSAALRARLVLPHLRTSSRRLVGLLLPETELGGGKL
eukprot:TRINITY_DN72132_c0_g1_i1.p1 TRINITY_DN72132_c0_g1~~TRINITY_DN72132_c0_g1_i1.p1  ORF type:complete len:503 (-),score=115.02 TRINITY_DN72132_c0_g1_i1:47-1555(-)